MKKLLSLLVIFAAVFSANAQLIQIGVTGDLAFDRAAKGKYFEDLEERAQPDLGWSAGLKLKISSMMGLGFDVAGLFAQGDRDYLCVVNDNLSSSSTDAMNIKSYSAGGRLKYLSIPINLRYDLKIPAISRGFIPYAYAGPEFNWYFDGIDWGSKDLKNQVKDYFKEHDVQWNLNFGFGVILVRHVEISFKHTVRLNDCLELNEIYKTKGSEIRSRFKDRTNKVALTLYF